MDVADSATTEPTMPERAPKIGASVRCNGCPAIVSLVHIDQATVDLVVYPEGEPPYRSYGMSYGASGWRWPSEA